MGATFVPGRVLAPIAVPARPLTRATLHDNVTLNWGVESTSYVNVSLAMTHPTVVLEDILSIVNVDCDATSVAVTFNSSAALDATVADWDAIDTFILITNHLGDCDAELERGFFIGTTVAVDAGALVANVTAEKSDVANTAAKTAISFSNIPAADASEKREIKINSTAVTISGDISLPSPVTLYEYSPYVTATAKSADISASVTLSGYIEYIILQGKLNEFYVDIDTSVSADVVLEVDVNAAYTQTFSYQTGNLEYAFVNIPGIINIGPALNFDIGVALAASGAVVVSGEVGAAIADGNIHLDFVDTNKTTTKGWTPTYNAGLNISEKAGISVDPFLDLTVELEFELLSGLLDLSGGVTAQPRFNNDFILTASQDVSTGGGVTQPGTACDQGVEIISEFEFSVIAFVTQFWKDTVYSVTVPIADKCYSWL
ncbi:hypothetical protein GQ53DRAFT_640483 [Thozetella sp. PMI_491]|nr:hypothetical protein GQ53DRAFT_640483 [Thozetella sp. PMI_491]